MSHSAPANVVISAHRALVLVAASWLLIGLSCDSSHDQNSPEPSSLETHQHTVLLRFRSIHHEADTSGVQSVMSTCGSFLTSRASGGKLSRHSIEPGYLPNPVRFLFPDSEVHTCTAQVSHFVGYQRAYGGDTNRYGAMDRYGTWDMWITLTGNEAVTLAGDTVEAGGFPLKGLPDTVRQNGLWELDITLDLSDFLSWNQSRTGLAVHTDRVSVRQR